MSVFTAKKLKEARNSAGLTQDEAANAMKISRRKLQLIEANESAISVDDIVEFTNQLLENMGVTPEQLHADAMENAPQIKPVEIKGMSEVLAEMMGVEQAEMMGVEQAEMMGIVPVAPEDEQMRRSVGAPFLSTFLGTYILLGLKYE